MKEAVCDAVGGGGGGGPPSSGRQTAPSLSCDAGSHERHAVDGSSFGLHAVNQSGGAAPGGDAGDDYAASSAAVGLVPACTVGTLFRAAADGHISACTSSVPVPISACTAFEHAAVADGHGASQRDSVAPVLNDSAAAPAELRHPVACEGEVVDALVVAVCGNGSAQGDPEPELRGGCDGRSDPISACAAYTIGASFRAVAHGHISACTRGTPRVTSAGGTDEAVAVVGCISACDCDGVQGRRRSLSWCSGLGL